MKKLFFLFLTLFVASSVWAYDFAVDGIYYDVDEELNSSVSVTNDGRNSYVSSITIPSSVSYDGKTYNVTSIGDNAFESCRGLTSITIPNSVTSIGGYAFYDCRGLTSVTIPNGVTSIGDYAFESCRGLTSITIPNSVTSIGEYAFTDCSRLTSVTIPNSVTSIGERAFSGCSGLTSIQVDNSNQMYCDVEGVLYNKDKSELICYPAGKQGTTFIIPEGVTTIGEIAFQSCDDLNSISIPNTVTSIGEGAFKYCSSLTSITIPNSVTRIGWYAFYDCSGLTSVIIPNSVGWIGGKAFYGCSGLTSVTIGNSVTSIGDDAFRGCSGLTSVIIPNSVTSIGFEAFYGCTSLKNVVIGENVTSIGENAFSDCSALSRVTCYAVNPPDADASSFSNYNGYLTIPCDNFEAYDIHPIWGSFKHVDCISAESTELAKDEVVVEPKISEAVFSMPTNASANSYTLTIQSNGVTFCTLTFNNQGQLANIDFSGSQLKAAVEGYQFTVTGLSASTGYNYSFKALDKSKSVLKEYTGSFTTKNADGTGGSITTAIENVELANAISIVNNQIFINGEAPAFVITSLGQKVANQNLKAGIYFVVVEGQNVKVMIN